jgi:hypothetical protein
LRAERIIDETGTTLWHLVDEHADLELPSWFLRHLHNQSMSPNTIVAYARDLTHFFRFLTDRTVVDPPASEHRDPATRPLVRLRIP